MTDEGNFPKSDGDIAYASESNRYAWSPSYVVYGNAASEFTTVGSSTAGLVAGSLVVPAGNTGSQCTMKGVCFTDAGFAGNTGGVLIGVSGADFGASQESLFPTLLNSDPGFSFDGMLAPDAGFYKVLGINENGDMAGGTVAAPFACYPNSGLVVFFKIKHNKGTNVNIKQAQIEFGRTNRDI